MNSTGSYPSSQPELTFFCELDAAPFGELFARDSIFESIQRLNARLSIGLLDLSPERARIIQRLNAAGIPLTAWLLLPLEQGYYFNLDNAADAAALYERFLEWTQRFELDWQALGLDIEPDLRGLRALAAGPRGAARFLRQARQPDRLEKATAAYTALVNAMHTDRYIVESYQFPFILDERRCGSRLVQRLTGIIDPPVDREVLMLYTSFYPAIGAGILGSFGREAGHIALGSTGGGVTVAGLANPNPLTWDLFQRDLRIANQFTRSLYVFSLEGCVWQGFLARLADFDWSAPVEARLTGARRVSLGRRLVRGALRLSRLFA